MAAAAYRSGQQLADDRTGQNHDFTRKRGVEYTNIITPHDIEVSRAELWNAAEAAENRKDARTAREWLVALPDELTHEQRIELVNQFGRELSNRYGAAVDIAIHAPDKNGDDRNHHAHILMTTREVHAIDNRLQLGAKTNLEISNTKREKLGLCKTDDEIKIIREEWANHANGALERAGKSERIDHRSNAARGIEQEPTIHEGVTATAMKRRGIDTAPVVYNKNIKHLNHEREQLKSAVHNFDKELDTLTAERTNIEKQLEAYKLDRPVEKEYTKEQVLGAALKTIRNYNAAVQQQVEKIKSERRKVNNQPDLERIARERKQIEFERQQLGPRPMLIGQERWEQRNNELNTRLFELNTKEKDLQTRHDPEQARDKTRAIEEVQREQPELAQRHEKAQQYLERENNPQKAEKAQRLAEARAIGEREAAMTQPERDKEREAAAERQRNYDRQR